MRITGWLPRLFAIIAAGALLITAVVVAVAPRIWHVANAHDELPVVLPEFEALAQRTYVYDVNGKEIAVYELENSQPIAYEDVPPQVVQAFLIVEDKEFFNHDGVNVRSLIRATLSNFASDSPQQGASTITMQVVKNDFLAGLERDGRYKLLQAHYARMLEKEMTKEQILERYLNTVFFGNNAYGIQAAAETYFGKTAGELSFIESAFLAGLVRSPSGFDPINEPERSRARWLQVTDRLVTEKILTEEERAAVLDTFAIPARVKTIPTRSNERSYFTEALRDYLLNRSTILGATTQDRYNQLFRGGLRIYTTLDITLQQLAEDAHDVLPATGGRFENAIVSLDSTSGAIRAMVGGSGFIPNEREVNMALSPRQTGSSIKFLILAAAVQAGAQAGDVIDGVRGCTLPNAGDPNEPFFQINGGASGSITNLAEQTWSSINCAFARLSQIVGLNRIVDTVYRAAESPYLFRGQQDRAELLSVASFATGANELSPLDMAAGIQTVANEGVHKQPYYVDFITDAEGARTYTHFDPGTKVFDQDTALLAIDILKGVLRSGTARRHPLADGRAAFGKTGTQQDNTNAWFVGGTKQLSTAVWVGDPDAYTPMVGIDEFLARGVNKVQGGLFPAEIWKAFMDPAHTFLPQLDWDAPPAPERPNARLFLPGNECIVEVVGFEIVEPEVDPNAPPTTPPPADAPPAETVPPETIPIVEAIEVGTTISPDNLDPNSPLPTIEASASIGPCR
ncbi:MAG: membrane peptidoglycan carboxypeptidase [Gammaproteobacteria bacterium]